MTDNEIIKELQAASEWFTEHGRNTNNAIVGICDRAIDLINRQKVEVESLKIANEKLYDANKHQEAEILEQSSLILSLSHIKTTVINNAKAEAVKEFAERLKIRLERKYTTYGREYVLRHLRELVKEFTEG